MTAFYTVLLTVVRSLNIIRPVYKVDRRLLVGLLLLAPILWLGVVLSEVLITTLLLYPTVSSEKVILYMAKDFVVFPKVGGALVYSALCNENGVRDPCPVYYESVNLVAILFLPYGLPSLISLLSTSYQTYFIMVKKRSRVTRTSKRLTLTIIMLTVSFWLCNTTYIFTNAAMFKVRFTESTGLGMSFVSYTLMYLNTLIAPAVMCIRGKSLNKYVRSWITWLRKKEEVKAEKERSGIGHTLLTSAAQSVKRLSPSPPFKAHLTPPTGSHLSPPSAHSLLSPSLEHSSVF